MINRLILVIEAVFLLLAYASAHAEEIYNIEVDACQSPYYLFTLGKKVFFSNDDGVHGRELWITDCTIQGTRMVKDIYPGANSSIDLNSIFFAEQNGKLFFVANDGTHGFELWSSDGTATGTKLVKDIYLGEDSAYPCYPTNVNGQLFFSAYEIEHGRELWKSDGTQSGTKMVKDIFPYSDSSMRQSNTRTLDDPSSIGGILYFVAHDGEHGYELWKSDGSTNGTVMVRDIDTTDDLIDDFPDVCGLTPVGNKLFFFAYDDQHGGELWTSDGTNKGTNLVKDINYGQGYSLNEDFLELANMNGKLFFKAKDNSHGYELWKSDGSAAGTIMVKDINTGESSSSPEQLYVYSNKLFFFARDQSHGKELWSSDGTLLGTSQIKDIYPGSEDSYPGQLSFVGLKNFLFFIADDGTHGYEPWRTDGTNSGTHMIKDMRSYYRSIDENARHNMAVASDSLLFIAYDGSHSSRLWTTKSQPRNGVYHWLAYP